MCLHNRVHFSLIHNSEDLEGLPGGAGVKSLPANAGDAPGTSSIPGRRRCPGEGNGSPLQYSCLDSVMDRGGWWATVHGVALSGT